MLYFFNKYDRENFINLLSRMLEFDYRKRIKIKEAINHEFLKNDNDDEYDE